MTAADAPARIAFEACPLCAATAMSEHRLADCSHHPLYQPGLPARMRWLRCAACGHVFTDGYWSDAALAVIFASANPHQMPGSDVHRSREIAARMVERVLLSGRRAEGLWIDVGFGNGALLGAAEEFGFDVFGLDLRVQAVELMKHYGVPAQAVDFLAYTPAQRAAVLSFADVLEHIPHPGPVLQHAHRVLADDGLLFASMPNLDCHAWRLLDAHNANPYWGELEHYHNFGRRRLEALLREHGFEPIAYGVSERYYLCMEVLARKR